MATTQIQSASIVRLRSGGPDMTVSSIDVGSDAIYVHCVWFDGRKNLQQRFRFHVLELVDPAEPSVARP